MIDIQGVQWVVLLCCCLTTCSACLSEKLSVNKNSFESWFKLHDLVAL